MGRDPSSLRAGQHAVSGAAFLALLPAASAALLLALRFVFARGLLSPLVTLLTYWAGACGGWDAAGPALLSARTAANADAATHWAGGATKVPVLAALLLFALSVLTFLAVQLYCAQTHSFVDNRNVRAAFWAEWRLAFGC